MSQQAPTYLIGISRRLKGILCHPHNPALSTSLGRLSLLFSISVFLTFWLTTGSVDATVLFQSPQSPPAQPPAEQPVIAQPAAEQPPAQQAPPAQPPAEQPAAQPPAEQPAAQPPAEQPPAAQPPAEQPPAQQTPPAEQTIVEPAAAPTQPEPVSRRREEAPADEATSGGSSNFILDQAEFVDTVIVSGAYIWLCCGVGTLLLVPLVLLFVYIRGRSKITGEGY